MTQFPKADVNGYASKIGGIQEPRDFLDQAHQGQHFKTSAERFRLIGHFVFRDDDADVDADVD